MTDVVAVLSRQIASLSSRIDAIPVVLPGPAGAPGNLSARVDTLSAVGGQTAFTLSLGGSLNGLAMFVNGHKQRLTHDYVPITSAGAVTGVSWTNADFVLTPTDVIQVAYFVLN